MSATEPTPSCGATHKGGCGATSAHDNGLKAWRAAGITDYGNMHIGDDASEFFAEHAPDIRYWRAPADDYIGLHDHSWC